MAADTNSYLWRIEAGERETISFPVLDDNDNAYPITGWVVDAKIKTRPAGTTLYTFPDADITVTSNTIELVIPAPVSDLWTFTTGWYRVRISNPATPPADPASYRVLEGTFVVDPA